MSCFMIQGGNPLSGEITASGNKNAVLPMLAACLLTDEELVLENVPAIRDVHSMLTILEHVGVKVDRGPSGIVKLCAASAGGTHNPRELC